MILLRHPAVAVAPGLCYGRLDVPLAEPEPAVAGLIEALPACPVRSSPATRCLTLARPLAAALGVPLAIDPRLAELDFGRWEGLTWDRIDRAESDPWAEDPWRIAPPGGETFAALHGRVAEALSAPPAILVTHAGPIRAARMIVEGLSFDAAFRWSVPHARPIRLGVPA